MVEQIESISNKEQLIKFIYDLAKDAKEKLFEWDNTTISEYLESIAGWIEDNDEQSLCPVKWDKKDLKLLAKMLYMGKIYE